MKFIGVRRGFHLNLRQVIQALCDRAIAERDEFTRLDQEVGDGDFGVNIERGAIAVRATIHDAEESVETSRLLTAIGRKLNAAGCGTSGTLLSFAILAGAKQCQSLTSFLQAALVKIQTAGETTVGDKTMVDALFPAVQVLTQGGSLEEAAAAAREGELQTCQMLGKRGRAFYSQSRALGVPDPGAHLIAVLFSEAARCCVHQDSQ
jgi:triose/dihydroxyacetone kinase / FAD-AMP lyase (cyclizing)